jgi:hypothetical protein
MPRQRLPLLVFRADTLAGNDWYNLSENGRIAEELQTDPLASAALRRSSLERDDSGEFARYAPRPDLVRWHAAGWALPRVLQSGPSAARRSAVPSEGFSTDCCLLNGSLMQSRPQKRRYQ